MPPSPPVSSVLTSREISNLIELSFNHISLEEASCLTEVSKLSAWGRGYTTYELTRSVARFSERYPRLVAKTWPQAHYYDEFRRKTFEFSTKTYRLNYISPSNLRSLLTSDYSILMSPASGCI